LRDLYGTVDRENGIRKYRRSFSSVGKQNGKSFLLGGLPIYHLLMEAELQPEAYGVASARDQAAIVYKAAALSKMIANDRVLGVEGNFTLVQ
jgi:phage terminase large subunit-like protein